MAAAAVHSAKRSLRAEMKQRLRTVSAEERLRQSRLLTQKVRGHWDAGQGEQSPGDHDRAVQTCGSAQAQTPGARTSPSAHARPHGARTSFASACQDARVLGCSTAAGERRWEKDRASLRAAE